MILDPLALKIMLGEITEGSHVSVGSKNDLLTLRTEKKLAKAL